MAKVDPGTLSDLVRGRRRPTFATLQAVCMTLELDLREVIRFGDDATPPQRLAS
jgi:transcriptional regulator with XRE-family HTH domain